MDEMKREAAFGSPALSAKQEVLPEASQLLPELSAKDVADAFVLQYYHILRVSPEDVHKFYKDASNMDRPGSEGMMLSASTVQEINDVILSSTYKEWEPDMQSVHAQDSVMGSVIVGVTGSLSEKNSTKRTFAQTFFLAPQEIGGFYVHNDFVMFLDANEPSEILSVPEGVPYSPTSLSLKESDVPINEEERISVLNPTPKEASEILKKLATPASLKMKSEISVAKPVENAQEDDLRKISYASILAKEVSLSMSAQLPSPPVTVLPKAALTAPSKASAPPTNGASGINGGSSAEAPMGIHIKDLAPDVTEEALLKVFQKFGIVKPRGVQIREYPEDGYRYAFVEFESPKAASSAVEGGDISIGGRNSEVQYKRASNQGGSNHGKSSTRGRGVYRNDKSEGRVSEGRGNRNDGEPHGSNWRSSTQVEGRGGSSGATRRNGGSTIRV
ncbi:putative nucleotide-binding alpha-beta plait domain, NTF2-like domain protein [Heracleum sosnowskyi]|uniref:Nucleotide-binding alpha-beta plait domain, NTF2-like domain protein n=1 Tax=Heracleum sosnowskyi TaxID=360622 RepID=A0AAD8HZE5_9APIA|nr:putative nucleotide-binding alpha-beta plait domain, NTF2-like domain protein [Heracleum sosnowskyi]